MEIKELVSKINTLDIDESFINEIEHQFNINLDIESEKIKKIENYGVDICIEIVRHISGLLQGDDKEVFYNSIHKSLLVYCDDDKYKISQIEKREIKDRSLLVSIIRELDGDEIKKRCVIERKYNDVELDLENITSIMIGIKDDSFKIDNMEKKNYDKNLELALICSIKDFDYKMKYLDQNKNDLDMSKIIRIIKSIENQEDRIRCINSLPINLVMEILDYQKEKVDFAKKNYRTNEFDKESITLDEINISLMIREEDFSKKIKIICSIINENNIIVALKYIDKENLQFNDILAIIERLQQDENKMILIDFIKEEDVPKHNSELIDIMEGLKSDDSKLKMMRFSNYLTNVSNKKEYLIRIICELDSDTERIKIMNNNIKDINSRYYCWLNCKEGNNTINGLIKDGLLEYFLTHYRFQR